MKNMAVVLTFLVSSSCFAFGGLGGLGSMNLSGVSEINNSTEAQESKLDQEKSKKKKKNKIRHAFIEGKKISFYKKK